MFQSPRHPRPLESTQRQGHQFFVIKDPTQAFCREDLLEVYKGVPTFDQRRKIHPVRIGDPKSGTDFAPRHWRRHLHHHQRHGRTQESRFARKRVRANFARTIFGVELLNDDKRHVLQFVIIWRVIGFEGGKLPKIVFADFEGLHHIALRSKWKTFPIPCLDQVGNGLFEDQQGRWKQGKRSLGTNPTGGLVTVMPVPTNEASHTFSSLVHIFSSLMKSTRSVTPMGRH